MLADDANCTLTPLSDDRPWRAALASGAALLALSVVAFADAWGSMARVWRDSVTFSHGYLILPISAWLLWRRRDAIQACRPKPAAVGVAAFVAACALWALGRLIGAEVITHVAVVTTIVAVVVATLGVEVARTVAFPLLFLYFMVPAGEFLNAPLMEWTADATVAAVRASGVPVHREGLHFTLPTGRWSVVEACSGLRYVIAGLTLASLFAYLNFRSSMRRVAFVALAVAVAVVANWARAYLIVMIGHLTEMRHGTGADHVWYGWVFFGLTMFAVFWAGGRWGDAPIRGAAAGSVPRSRTVGAVPVRATRQSVRAGAVRPAAGHMLLGILAVGIAGIVGARTLVASATDVEPRAGMAEAVSGLVATADARSFPLAVAFSGSRDVIAGRAGEVDAMIAYFARQVAGHEMITYGNAVHPEDRRDVRVVSMRRHALSGDPDGASVAEAVVDGAGGTRLVWHWYTVGGRHVASETEAKLAAVPAALTGRGDHATVTILTTPAEEQSLGQARGRLEEVALRLRPATARFTGATAEAGR